MRACLVCFLFFAAAGCSPEAELLVGADAGRLGALGEAWPHGAMLHRLTLRARGDRPVDVDVIVSADDDGEALADLPPVLIVQGGSAAVARYHWLGAHLATRGAAVVMPHFLGDLAFFSAADGPTGLDAARAASAQPDGPIAGAIDADAPAVVVGHSLGGVVGADLFLDDDDGAFAGLALLCSFPAERPLPRRGGHIVTVAAGDDGLIDVDEIDDSAAAMADAGLSVTAAVAADLTHYQLTDDASEAELEREGTTGGDLDEGRRRATFLIDALRESPAVLASPSSWPAGLSPLGAGVQP